MKDFIKIYVKAGRGGNGCLSFRREKYVPYGGPNGGDGGNGGNVFIETSDSVQDLGEFIYKPYFKAQNGEHGKGGNKHGQDGKNIIIKVPVGTIVKDAETGEILKDLIQNKEKILVAKGGKGGRGNAKFATSTNRAPRKVELGTEGEEKVLTLELKLIADIGLVGFPNVGKSTLLSHISSATPKTANYPFTTLSPVLGIVKIKDKVSFSVADIPGLIDDAHLGKGLGDKFLRHIERTKALIYLLDLSTDALKDPSSQFTTLYNTLKLYNPLLIKKPYFIVGNKIDLVSSKKTYKNLKNNFEIFPISALLKKGLKKLIIKMYDLLKENEK